MDAAKFIAAVKQLADEKNIPSDQVMEVVRDAFRAAYRKEYGDREEEIEVELDDNSTNVTILLVKEVVKKSDLTNEHTQITVEEAKGLKSDIEPGDILKIDVTPVSYGRIAAQSAKQVIIQKIQEAEREAMYEAYKDHEDEILQATINRTDGRNVYVDLEKASAVLTHQNQIPNEHYRPGMQIKVYLEKVARTSHGPEFIISRSHANLVRELFRLEIPEIQNGIVEIKAIAREAGIRTKVAVSSTEEGVDPIGACVGQKGVRIQAVMEEINNERIDVIEWSEDPMKFIQTALAPAEISKIELDEESRRAGIYVTEDQRALAIGKSGQNVRLAGILTGWELDILNVADLSEEEQKDLTKKKQVNKAAEPVSKEPSVENIADLEGVDESIANTLKEAGFEKVMQLQGLNAEALQGIDGISEKDAKKVEEAVINSKQKPGTEKKEEKKNEDKEEEKDSE